jgi:hypothetical protein
MVKISNAFGDMKRGVQGRAVYQGLYGQQIRRVHVERKDAGTITQHDQRQRFRRGISWWKSLTHDERQFLIAHMEEAGIKSPDGYPTTLYSYVKKIAMTVPEVSMETEEGPGGCGYYWAWARHAAITVNNETGAQVSNIPIEVIIPAESEIYDHCKEDGSDIRFTTSNLLAPLSYCLDVWAYEGVSRVWVLIETLAAGETSPCDIVYDNPSCEDESDPNIFLYYNDFKTDPGMTNPSKGKYILENGLSIPEAYILLELYQRIASSRGHFGSVSNFGLFNNEWTLYAGIHHTDDSDVTYELSGVGLTTSVGYSPPDTGEYEAEIRVSGIGEGKGVFLVNGTEKGTFNTANIERQILGLSGGVNSYHYWDYDDWDEENECLHFKLRRSDAGTYLDWRIKKLIITPFASPYPEMTEIGEARECSPMGILKGFSIQHPAIKGYEIIGAGIKEDGLSNLTERITASVRRENLYLSATAVKVTTLDGQVYTFPVQ